VTLPGLACVLVLAIVQAGCVAGGRAPLTGTMDQIYADAVGMYAAAGDSLVYAMDAGLVPEDALDDLAGLNDATRTALVGLEQAAANGDRGTFEGRLAHFRTLVRALLAVSEGAQR
jgi:hypothetical protein